MGKHGLENLVVTGSIEGRRVRGHQRLKYLCNLCTSWKDNVSPTQLISTSEDRELWRHMVTNMIIDSTAP